MGQRKMTLRRASALTAHVAVFILAVIALFGNVAKLKVSVTAPLDRKVAAKGLPFMVELKNFTVEEYPGSSPDHFDPKQFTSELQLTSADGTVHDLVVSVNHPAAVGAWRFYQSGYDVAAGKESRYSIILAVRDPMWPAACAALWMMMASALLLMTGSVPEGKDRKWLWTGTGVLFVLFVYWVISKLGIGARNLRPALRSPWFIPHIVAYMFAYATLTAAAIYAIVLWARNSRHPADSARTLALDRLTRFGWSFFTLGMMMGALWAKEAWGDYWTWDPKETWALATWTGYLVYIHLTGRIKDRPTAYALLLLSFLLLQMCWYGVNFLPTSAASLHTY